MMEIRNGLAAGKEVTVHQSPITQSGWTGSGYIVTDPATGSGAYKIAGGANGGSLLTNFFFALVIVLTAFLILEGILIMLAATTLLAFLLGLLVVVWEVTTYILFLNDTMDVSNPDQFNTLVAGTVISAIVGLIPAYRIGEEFGAVAVALQYSFLALFAEFQMIMR